MILLVSFHFLLLLLEKVSVLGFLHDDLNAGTWRLQRFVAQLCEILHDRVLLFFAAFLPQLCVAHTALWVQVQLTTNRGLLEWRLLPLLISLLQWCLEPSLTGNAFHLVSTGNRWLWLHRWLLGILNTLSLGLNSDASLMEDLVNDLTTFK